MDTRHSGIFQQTDSAPGKWVRCFYAERVALITG
jgi:hypothetical protein